MSAFADKIKIRVRTSRPEEQAMIQSILEDLKRTNDFSSINTEIKVQKSKFAPEEVLLMIVIGFAGQLSADLAIAFLRKIWDRFKEEKIIPEMEELDQVQNRAENYIRGLGILRFRIIEMEDYGLCVQFKFQDSQKKVHILLVSKTDLAILRYLRQEDD